MIRDFDKMYRRLKLPGMMLGLALPACGGGRGPMTADVAPYAEGSAVATVTIQPARGSVNHRWTRQLTATLKDAEGHNLTRTVAWSSSDPSIATVSSAGLVTGNAPGDATIMAVAGEATGRATIHVVAAPVASVKVTPVDAPVAVGDTVRFTAAVTDSLGFPLQRPMFWISSAGAVVTVSSTGLAVARAAGSATITAVSEGRSGTSVVTVSPPVTPPVTPPPAPSPPPAAGEPVFTPGLDTSLLGRKDGTFDGYSATPSVTQAGWQFNGTLISPGRGGSGHAARLTWRPLGANREPMQYLAASWSRRANVIVSFWFRTSPGADPTSGRSGQSGFKWLVLSRDANAGDPNGRITAGVHSLQQGFRHGAPDAGVQFTVNDQSVAAGGFWQNMTRSVGWNSVNQRGTTQRQRPVNDGNWHRYTLHANPFTNTVQVWVDGVLIISSNGLNYPMFDQGWDQVGFGQNVVPDLLAGWQFTVDYDDVQVFVRP